MVVFLIPAYNEEMTILDVLERVRPFADYVVVVDDGSKDTTPAKVVKWMQGGGRGVLLSCLARGGMSSALKAGFIYLRDQLERSALSGDDIVVTVDADGQHVPEMTPQALETMRVRGYDVLVGLRDLSGYPCTKRLGNWLLSFWASTLAGQRVRDVECGFRLMRVEVLMDILPYYTGRAYGCAQEIAIATLRRHWRLGNDFPVPVAYYRQGARVRDGMNNVAMGTLAWLRVRLDWPVRASRRVPYVIVAVSEAAAGLSCSLV